MAHEFTSTPGDKPQHPGQTPSAEAAGDNTEHPLNLAEVARWLADDGLVPPEVVDQFISDKREWRGAAHPLTAIAECRWKSLKLPHRVLDLETLTEWLAGRTGLPYFHIDPLRIDFSAITDVMSNAYSGRFRILPVEVRNNQVTIATAQPFMREWEAELQPVLHKEIRRVMANPEDIARYRVEFYNLARSIKRATQTGEGRSGLSSFEQLVELGHGKSQLDANDQHIVQIVDWLWQYAFEQRASDIHMEPRRDIGLIRFRIDGILHQVYQIPMAVMSAMTSRIKLLGRMDIIEKRRPQDGRIKTRTPARQEVELRLSTLPTAFGEKLVMRIFDPDVLVRDFSDLGFSESDAARWRAMTAHPNGLILVTGPTGSGKTTTLYSTLKSLATPEVNVCTVEDPIEMVEPAFNQMQVQHGLDLSFAEGLRSLMRQDPDIIMVGEIRDLETAEMAIQAALTGHLVLSTLHTNDAPSAITRLLDLGVPAYLLKSTLLGIMAQRLVRTLCPHCKTSQPLIPEDEKLWAELVMPWRGPPPARKPVAVGCLECRMTGYSGRMGLYEILVMSPEVKKHIQRKADLGKLRDQACREGMMPLRVAGAQKVAAGLTTLEEVQKVVPPAEDAEHST
jgi:general secretion pathway protein E